MMNHKYIWKKKENLSKIILNYGLKGSRWRIVKTADSTFGWKPVLGILGMDLDLDKFVSL